jgi:pyruvate formate lyase activating enzyme
MNDVDNTKGNLIFKREFCNECYDYDCTKACNTGALKTAGYYITIEDLLHKINRDRDYWGEDGGITLTGGEPLMQPVFTREILKKCYESYIHTAIETCGNVEWKRFADIIDFTEWIFFDIKHIDSNKHKEWTGADNRIILENILRLKKHFNGRIIIRTPLVPGFNDSIEDMESIANFMLSADLKEINILPLHHLGMEKYNLLGISYFDDKLIKPEAQTIHNIVNMFEQKGIDCYEGYKTPF